MRKSAGIHLWSLEFGRESPVEIVIMWPKGWQPWRDMGFGNKARLIKGTHHVVH